MAELLAMLALAALCWLFRITFVLLVPPDRLPPRVQEALTYLAPAVLGGIAAVELSSVVTPTDPTGSALALVAMGLVVVVAYRFRNLSLTVLVGLVAVLAIDLVR
jgi:branched-subunit amino acid transport protein